MDGIDQHWYRLLARLLARSEPAILLSFGQSVPFIGLAKSYIYLYSKHIYF